MIYIFLPFLLFVNPLFASQPVALPMPGPGAGAKPGAVSPIPGMPDFSMSEQEFNEMIEFLSKLDEKELAELEQLGRQVLTDMGINPDTLEPIPGSQPAPTPGIPAPQPPVPAQPQPKPEPSLPPTPEISGEDRARMTQILNELVQVLNEIRLKASSVYLYDDILPIDPKIDSLVYYSKVITQKAHVARLFDKQFEPLRKNLEALLKALKAINTQLSADTSIIESIDDPYFILNVADTATTEEVTAAYETLKAMNDPEKIRESAQADGLSESDIKKLIKQSKINFSTIQDAYDKLNDPELRDEVDHERADIIDHLQQTRQALSGLVKQFVRKFEEFAQEKQLMVQIEEFMKKYEPYEASQRKSMQKAEEERIKEIKALSAARPVMSPGFVFEPRVKYGTPKPSFDGGFPSYTPPSFPSTPSEKPGIPSKPEEDKTKRDGKKPGDKGKKDDKDKKDKDKDKKDKDKDKKKGDGKKPGKSDTKAPKGWDLDLAQNMQGAVKKFEPSFKELTKLNAEQKLTDLQPYMHDLMATTADDVHDTTVNEIIEKGKLEDLQEFLSKTKDKLPKDLSKKGALDPQIIKGYQVAWDPFYKQYGKTIKKLGELTKALVSPSDTSLPLNPTRVAKHIGTLDTPKPFAKLYNITKSIAENTEKIQETLHPELKKKKPEDTKKK
jgi:hypothetical protein